LIVPALVADVEELLPPQAATLMDPTAMVAAIAAVLMFFMAVGALL
jgi:hypothetical protein